jgi:NADPH2:quinone reductase
MTRTNISRPLPPSLHRKGASARSSKTTSRLPVELLKAKSAAFHWEFMFTRSMFGTPDMLEQHKLLTEVARLIDAGTVKTTLGRDLGKINATNLREAHRLLEEGRAIGKLVLTGF